MRSALFRMPPAPPKRIDVSARQLYVMDLIALRDGTPLGEVPDAYRITLRRLIAKGLIQCVVLGPAIYVLTPIGRIVRARS